VLVIWAVGELGRIGSLFCCRFGCERLVVSMAVHGTLNPELGAKARVDIYEGGGGQEEEGGGYPVGGGEEGGIHTRTQLAD